MLMKAFGGGLGPKRFDHAGRLGAGIDPVQKTIKGRFDVPESFGTDPLSVWRNVIAT
jgi:hypothetical protein